MAPELVTSALGFGQIIGLIANFKAERRYKKDDDDRDFVDWLTKKRHDDVVRELAENNLLARSVRLFLRENHEEVIRKLNTLDELILGIASKIDGVSEIAAAVAPNSGLSNQAVEILRELAESNGQFLCDVGRAGGAGCYLDIPNVKKIKIEEPRFLEDDMKSLCNHGLLIAGLNSQGIETWKLTRTALKFIQEVKESEATMAVEVDPSNPV